MATVNEKLQLEVTAKGIQQAQTQFNGLNASMSGLIKPLAGITAGVLTFATAMKLLSGAYKSWQDQELALKKLNIAIENSGRAGELSAAKLSEMASSMQRMSNYADEIIEADVLSTLILFRNIPTESIAAAAQATLDLGTNLGDLKSAAEIVGRALENPLRGVRQLRAANIILSQSEQTLIKDMMDTGRLADAQALILGKITEKYNGMAASQIKPLTQLKNSIGDLMELVGGGFGTNVDAIATTFSLFIDEINKGFTNTAETAEEMARRHYQTQTQVWSALLSQGRIWATYMLTIYKLLGAEIVSVFKISFNSITANFKTIFDLIGSLRLAYVIPLTGDISKFTRLLEKIKSNYKPVQQSLSASGQVIANETNKAFATVDNFMSDWQNMTGKSMDIFDARHKKHTDELKKNITDADAEISKIIFASKSISPYMQSKANPYVWDIDQIAKNIDEMKGMELDSIADSQEAFSNAMAVFEARAMGGAELINAAFSSLGNSFAELLPKFNDTTIWWLQIMRNFANDMIAELNRIIAKQAVMSAWNTILNITTGGVAGTGSGLFDFIGSLFSNGGSSTSQLAPISGNSLAADMKNAISGLSIKPEVVVYVDPKEISRAAEIGSTLRFANA